MWLTYHTENANWLLYVKYRCRARLLSLACHPKPTFALAVSLHTGWFATTRFELNGHGREPTIFWVFFDDRGSHKNLDPDG